MNIYVKIAVLLTGAVGMQQVIVASSNEQLQLNSVPDTTKKSLLISIDNNDNNNNNQLGVANTPNTEDSATFLTDEYSEEDGNSNTKLKLKSKQSIHDARKELNKLSMDNYFYNQPQNNNNFLCAKCSTSEGSNSPNYYSVLTSKLFIFFVMSLNITLVFFVYRLKNKLDQIGGLAWPPRYRVLYV